jgi:hypothetical protein
VKPCLALLLLAGCFPYRELYRPDVVGRVVDEGGTPVAGADVRSCSYTHQSMPPVDCPRPASSTSEADGGFRLPRLSEWEWCCVGEAPLPMTEVFVCTEQGGAAFIADSQAWPQGELMLRLGTGSPRCAGK